ncbi:hypothetical protein DICPUDRAFT_17662, partial [Dictyostelium purpureum]
KKQVITLPIHLPSLSPEVLSNYKQIFIVDLQSFSNKQCNRLLNQTLFGKLKNEDAIILVIIKSKFSPKCRECGIGDKNSKLFLKDRFVKSGDGRVLFELDSTISSLAYRKELCKYVYNHNKNIVLLTEDKVVGYDIVGSSVPKEDTEKYNCYFQIFGEDDDGSNKTKEEQVSELQNKATLKVEKWIKERIERGDEINLPKNIESLEKSISPFCKAVHSFSNNAHIINKLRECGDIKICDTCESCVPTSTNLENQFYFSYLSLSDEEHKQFDWLLKSIISEYMKTPNNLVPIPLEKVNKFSLSEVVNIPTSIVVKSLIENKVIELKGSAQPKHQNNLDLENDNSSFINDFDNISISSFRTTTSYSSTLSPFKKQQSTSPFASTAKKLYSSPIKKTSSSSLSPLKKQGPKYSYSGRNSNSLSSIMNTYSNSEEFNKKAKIKYN